MGLDKNIARVEKLDEHTVKFTLNEVDAAFIQNLAMPFPSIQSAEYAAQLLKQGKASDINQKPIGTGPFVFSRYQKDAQIRFKGNKDYWKSSWRRRRSWPLVFIYLTTVSRFFLRNSTASSKPWGMALSSIVISPLELE